MDCTHLDAAQKNRHTYGHCVPCCDAIRLFGKGSPFADNVVQEHIRYMNTVPQ